MKTAADMSVSMRNMFCAAALLTLLFAYGCEARCYDRYNDRYYNTGARFRRTKPMRNSTLTGLYDCECRSGGRLYCSAFDIPCYDVVKNTFIPKNEKFVVNFQGKYMKCTCLGMRGRFGYCQPYTIDGCLDISTNTKVKDGEYYTTRKLGAEVTCVCDQGQAARASCRRATTGCRDYKTKRLVRAGEKYLVESFMQLFECTCGDDGQPRRGTCRRQTQTVQIDPCQNADCHPMAQCHVRGSSYYCTCKFGYRGSGRDCTDVDECSGRNRCHANANCENTEGSYSCTCEPGYEGDGFQCKRHDPCDQGVVFCDMNAKCIPSRGSYQCICGIGFTGDGFSCQDLDECATGIADCDENASCQNVPGLLYRCTCNQGYEGDGRDCTKMCLDDWSGRFVANHDVFVQIKNGRRQTCTCQDGEAVEGSCFGEGPPEVTETTTVSTTRLSTTRSTTAPTTTTTAPITTRPTTASRYTKRTSTARPARVPKCLNRRTGRRYDVGESYTWERRGTSYLCTCGLRGRNAFSRCIPVKYTP